MFSKRLLATILAFGVIACIGSVAFASHLTKGTHTGEEFGNLTVTLLNGGYSADYADGMVVFSNRDDGGTLWLRNINSNSQRKIADENASFINVVGRDIYYISSDAESFYIVKSNLNSEREIIVASETEISNLFVSEKNIYYLCGNSIVQYKISDGTGSVIFSNPEIAAFVPEEDGIYWLDEKPAQSLSHKDCHTDSYEGTEEENINFDCYLYSSENGTNIPADFAEIISTDSIDNNNGTGALALSVDVGGVKIPTDEFPVGSYFTDNGMRCNDHGTGSCGWDNESACNCKAFHNGVSLKAIQCYGYARYVYYSCFGDLGLSDSTVSSNLGTLESGEITQESFKALIEQAQPGAHLRVQYIKANGYSISTHSMIILDSNESGFSICEANADNKCGVSVRQLDYATFVPTLVSVNFLMMPDNYPGYVEETTTQPYGTPSDVISTTAEAQTSPTVTSPVIVATEQTTLGSLLSPNEIALIIDTLSFFVRIFVDCANAIIRIIASLI